MRGFGKSAIAVAKTSVTEFANAKTSFSNIHENSSTNIELNNKPNNVKDSQIAQEILACYLMAADIDKPMEMSLHLLNHYKSLSAILQESPSELIRIFDMPYKAVQKLRLARDLIHHAAYEDLKQGDLINSWNKAVEYLNMKFKGLSREQLRVLYLNAKNYLIADVLVAEGTINHVPLYIREVMQLTFNYKASSIIMAHNHPSGDPTPSEADIEMTHLLMNALGACNVSLHDHIIMGHGSPFSMRSNKLF